MDQFNNRAHADVECAAGHAMDVPPKALDLLGRWLDLSELERRAFAALAAELQSSSNLVETSALNLSESFQALAVSAQAQTARVEQIISSAYAIEVSGVVVPMDEALASVQTVLVRVIDTILTISKHAMRMVYALDVIASDVERAEQLAGQIGTINNKIRYLALNAAIEASRSSESGAAFNTIAREMKDLSLATGQTSRQVQDRVGAIASGVREGHLVLKSIATLDMSEHILAKERLDAVVVGMAKQNHGFKVALADTAGVTTEMAATIAQLITNMQFQDRAKQQLSLVVEALGVLGEITADLQQATRDAVPGRFPAGSVDEASLMKLVEKQSLAAVKQRILGRVLGHGEADAGGGQQVAADDIELF